MVQSIDRQRIFARFRVVVLAALVSTVGCQDTIVRFLEEDINQPTAFVQVDSFRFQAWDLDNIHDQRQWVWPNTGTQAVVQHRNFVHHGQVQITILDALGDSVYKRIPVEADLDNETTEGTPGDWTISVDFYGAKGRVDFSAVRKP